MILMPAALPRLPAVRSISGPLSRRWRVISTPGITRANGWCGSRISIRRGCAPGPTGRFIDTLEILGLEWDGGIVYQSDRLEYYRQALAELTEADLLYRCYCPRKITRGKTLSWYLQDTHGPAGKNPIHCA